MENLFKKQYEISLWKDILYWHRRKLVISDVSENNYKVGKFYSIKQGKVAGATMYALDIEPYNSEKTYYVLAPKEEGKYLEGPRAEDISIDQNNLNWYENGELVPNIIFQFYKEQKECVIGSDTMDTPIRAHEPKLVTNTNGSSTLTFTLYYKYYDYENDQLMNNPFTKMLVNEKKVKLRYGDPETEEVKWYDFVIKGIQENTENHTFTYTAKDLFINELSKSGFDIQFDAKLENNQGSILELGERVLEGSDWQLLPESNVSLQQTKSEALYEFTLKDNLVLTATSMDEDKKVIELKGGSIIYGFYTSVSEKLPFFQFLYCETDPQIDEDRHIINSPNYYIDNIEYEENGYPSFVISEPNSILAVTTAYRGKRVIRQIKTKFDPVMDKYVSIYKDSENNNNLVYGYVDEQYISPTAVRNFVVNGTDYNSTTGWDTSGVEIENLDKEDEKIIVQPDLNIRVLPDIFAEDYKYDPDLIYKSFLGIKFNYANQGLMNFGLTENRSILNGFAAGQEFIFRIKYGAPNSELGLDKIEANLKAKIVIYGLDNGIYNVEDTFVNFDKLEEDDYGYMTQTAICSKSLSYSDMTKSKIGLYIYPEWHDSLGATEIYIEDVQLFYKELDGTGNVVYPGGDLIATIKEEYVFYNPPASTMTADEVVPIYRGEKLPSRFIQQYNDDTNYEKNRSITVQESNRFNLIQDLCEIFECWPLFIIDHEKDGSIKLDENYRQCKWVTFKEFIGRTNDIGFRYGINLKSITRTVDSDAIVTKMIVKNNANQYATDGFCSIARAQENPSRQNFLLEFDYYISQKMLDFDEVWNDLYTAANGYIGYYTQLKEISIQETQFINEQSNLFVDQSSLEAEQQVAALLVEESEVLLKDKKQELKDFTGYTFEEIMAWAPLVQENSQENENENISEDLTEEESIIIEKNQRIKEWRENLEVRALCASIVKLISTIEKTKEELQKASTNLDNNLAAQQNATMHLTDLRNKKLALDLQFYKKYSRFLQEGSWIDENYVDDNLYYLDAESTLYTSAHPKVTYNINVLELSRIPEYENYVFNLGDKTFIEDTDFFGWTTIDGIDTPRHEEIIVNEITIMLDSPELNQIKVQNYKTQFEDLFQRITATTQAIEYSTGKYEKVTSVVQSDGTIAPDTLSNSMANNSFVISNARDQSVVWDSSGITTTSLSSPNEMVRIISGGIFISKDGGATWNTGITGNGINASYLTSGQIDTSKIRIMAGGFPSFRWDTTGLNAYSFELNEDGQTGKNFNSSKFVRFDQYGLYGINGISNFNPLIEDEYGFGEQKIWDWAQFALTWEGFSLRSNNGSVRITSDQDIQIFSNKKERVKLGRIGDNNYGLRISDAEERPVMITKDDGTLWLENALYIGADSKSVEEATVRIGLLEEKREGTGIHEVIHAGNNESKFIVYEDGKMYAEGAEFHGDIYAEGGSIGGLTIDQWKEKGYDLKVTSDAGLAVKDGQTVTLTAMLYHGTEEVQNVEYTWYNAEGKKKLHEGQTYSFVVNFGDQSTLSFDCRAKITDSVGS